MSPLVVGIIGIVFMLALMALRMPIAITMMVTGFAGAMYLMGPKAALSGLGTIPFAQTAHYTLSTIPMFVLMGQFVYYSGISHDLFDTFHKWLGRFPGGLAMATFGACAGFAAACGSSVAGAATMGSVALPEMEKLNYDKKLAAGTVAVGGTLGILIPPSTGFILYGILAEQSISKLFMAGILPGIMLTVFLITTVFIKAKLNPDIAPRAVGVGWKEKFTSLKGLAPILILFVISIGGLYAGVFTPTEAGGVGAFGAFIIGMFRKQFRWKGIVNSARDTVRTTCMIFAIVIGAMVFSYFLAITRLPIALADFVSTLPLPALGIMIIILLVYLVLGCFMDAFAMLIITIPIFFPAVLAMGFDPIWFGVILVMMIETAMITPPVGMNVYVISGVAPHIPLEDIFRGILMFMPAMIIAVLMLLFFPQIALLLPGTMG